MTTPRPLASPLRDAHALSAGLSPDPFYNPTQRTPRALTSSLFGDPQPANSPCWLYAAGDLEGHLMARMRQDAFTVCNHIYHPGAFRRPHSFVLFSHTFHLDSVPAAFPVSLLHSGNLRLLLNGTLRLQRDTTPHPDAAYLDLAPWLRTGPNHLLFAVTRFDAPPALLLNGPSLHTGPAWRCNTGPDWQCGGEHLFTSPVAAFPAAPDAHRFPHEESLPRATLETSLSPDGIANFGCVLLGRPLVLSEHFIGLGESRAEALSGGTEEQRPLQADTRDRAFQFVATLPPSPGQPASLKAEISLHPARYAGAFACSEPELTRLWHHAASTLRVCLRELTVDGLKRDRLPWAGDAFIATLGNAAAFGEHRCLQRTLQALAPEDPLHSPTSGILDYDLFWLLAVSAQWHFAGDVAFASSLWPEIKKILAALATRQDPQGLLRHEGTWLFLDWIEFSREGRNPALQALYLQALRAIASLAHHLGHPEDAALLQTRATRLAETIRHTFWNPATPPASLPAARHAGFFSELAGLVPPPPSGTWDGPPVGTPYMRYFECIAHARRGHPHALLDGLRSYWGGLLRAGASTLWESFDGSAGTDFYGRPFGKSLCHAWSCGPVPLLSLELVGLQITAPGMAALTCHPHPLPLAWACATVPTPHGDLHWDYADGRLHLHLPPGIALNGAPPQTNSHLHVLAASTSTSPSPDR